MSAGGPVVLETAKLRKEFGGVCAVDDVDMQVRHGTITALIGPNGAGKTTVFNLITGNYDATRGTVTFHDAAQAAHAGRRAPSPCHRAECRGSR